MKRLCSLFQEKRRALRRSALSESHVGQPPVPSLLKVLPRHVQLSGGEVVQVGFTLEHSKAGGQPLLPARPAGRLCCAGEFFAP